MFFNSNLMEINLNNQLDNKISLYSKCDFCKENIHGACLNCSDYNDDIINNTSNEYHFCDILCAKLYNDNISKLSVNYNDYRQKYLHNLLSKYAATIYELCKNKLFIEIIDYKFNEKELKYLNKTQINRVKKMIQNVL